MKYARTLIGVKQEFLVVFFMLFLAFPVFAYEESCETIAAGLFDDIENNVELIQAIRFQNDENKSLSDEKILQLDLLWREERKTREIPLIQSVLHNPASTFLRQVAGESDGLISEIIVMDNRGLNVAISHETSDYWQGDEDKWLKTFGEGSGAFHVSDVSLDDSTKVIQTQISKTFRDPVTGELLGAITLGLSVNKFHQLIFNQGARAEDDE